MFISIQMQDPENVHAQAKAVHQKESSVSHSAEIVDGLHTEGFEPTESTLWQVLPVASVWR